MEIKCFRCGKKGLHDCKKLNIPFLSIHQSLYQEVTIPMPCRGCLDEFKEHLLEFLYKPLEEGTEL